MLIIVIRFVTFQREMTTWFACLIPDISLPFLSVLEARKNVKTKDEQSHQVSHQVRLLRTQSSLISTNQSFHLLVMLVLVQQPIGLCGPRVHKVTHFVESNLVQTPFEGIHWALSRHKLCPVRDCPTGLVLDGKRSEVLCRYDSEL